MDESGSPNKEAVLAYLEGARAALQGAWYNLDGGFYGIAVSRAYYTFFYAATALLLTLDISRSKHAGVIIESADQFVKHCTAYLTSEGYL